jgi:CRISPR/Cas system-associated exonuclease Cas4 (RecB family)
MNERYDRVIRASEVGQYVYCAHAWWLGSVRGLASSRQREMAAGEIVHRRHGRRVRISLSLNRLAYSVLVLAVLVGIIWLLSWVGG